MKPFDETELRELAGLVKAPPVSKLTVYKPDGDQRVSPNVAGDVAAVQALGPVVVAAAVGLGKLLGLRSCACVFHHQCRKCRGYHCPAKCAL